MGLRDMISGIFSPRIVPCFSEGELKAMEQLLAVKGIKTSRTSTVYDKKLDLYAVGLNIGTDADYKEALKILRAADLL